MELNFADSPRSPASAYKATSLLGILASPVCRQELWSYGKSLSEKAQSFFSPKPLGEGELDGNSLSPIQNGLGEVVIASIHAQNEINVAQKVNRAVMLASALAHRRTEMMMKEGLNRLSKLQKTVANQSETIGQLNDSVSELRIEADVQKDATQRLRRALQENTQLLRDSISRYQEDKQAQDALIARQQSVLEHFQHRRVKRDLVVDTIIFVVCLSSVNISLVDLPIRLVLRFVHRRRLQTFLRQLIKFIVLIFMFSRSRMLAKSMGVHSSCGDTSSYLSYGVRLLRLLQLRFQRLSPNTPQPVSPHEPRTPQRTPLATSQTFLGSPLMATIATPSQWSRD